MLQNKPPRSSAACHRKRSLPASWPVGWQALPRSWPRVCGSAGVARLQAASQSEADSGVSHAGAKLKGQQLLGHNRLTAEGRNSCGADGNTRFRGWSMLGTATLSLPPSWTFLPQLTKLSPLAKPKIKEGVGVRGDYLSLGGGVRSDYWLDHRICHSWISGVTAVSLFLKFVE